MSSSPPRSSISVRGMLGIVAIAAFLCVVVLVWGRLAYRRSRIDAILRDQYERYNPFRGFLSVVPGEFELLREKEPAAFARLRADPEAVVRRLLYTIERPGTRPTGRPVGTNKQPDQFAATLLGGWVYEVDSVPFARSVRDRLLDLAMLGTLEPGITYQVVSLAEGLTTRLGIDDARRAEIRARARAGLAAGPGRSDAASAWLSFVGAIGGREEVALQIELAGVPDADVFDAVVRSGLRATRWPGIVPMLRPLAAPPPADRVAFGLALRVWRNLAWALGTPPGEIDGLAYINDGPNPITYRYWEVPTFNAGRTIWTGLVNRLRPLALRPRPDRLVLGMPVMLATRQGRHLLLGYAEDPRNPPQLRRKAIHMLKRDALGIRLLLAVCDDPRRRSTVARLFGRDRANLVGGYGGDIVDPNQWPVDSHWKGADAADPADPRPELRFLLGMREEGMERPISDLISGLNPARWTSILRQRHISETEIGPASRAQADRARRLLEALTPPPHPETQAEWSAWFRTHLTKLIPWAEYLAVLERYPGDDEIEFWQSQLTLPPDTEPILARMAHDHPSAYKAKPAKALLLLGGRWQEAEVIFDLMEAALRQAPDRLSARDPELVRTLVRRFAVNFGWDVDAWRSWYRLQGRPEAEAEARSAP